MREALIGLWNSITNPNVHAKMPEKAIEIATLIYLRIPVRRCQVSPRLFPQWWTDVICWTGARYRVYQSLQDFHHIYSVNVFLGGFVRVMRWRLGRDVWNGRLCRDGRNLSRSVCWGHWGGAKLLSSGHLEERMAFLVITVGMDFDTSVMVLRTSPVWKYKLMYFFQYYFKTFVVFIELK